MMEQAETLKEIEQSLLGIIAAITQTPKSDFKKVRLAAKVAAGKGGFAATTATIFGLVSTFGTAGTGAAIGGLHGAAATSATLAWIGGLVGGGMAAGALILPAAGVAGGLMATKYLIPELFGQSRKLGELLPFEDEILFGADNLLRPLYAIKQEEMADPSSNELRIYAHEGLKPLLLRIGKHIDVWERKPEAVDGTDDFQCTLKPKYQQQLRVHCGTLAQHVQNLSKPVATRLRRTSWLKRMWQRLMGSSGALKQVQPSLASVTIAVTVQRLLEEEYSNWNVEQGIVLDALRRSTNELENASIEELSAYLKGLSLEQLQGVISNTKGIYHEMLFVEMHNADSSDVSAAVMEATNHPGADIEFYMDGEVVREFN